MGEARLSSLPSLTSSSSPGSATSLDALDREILAREAKEEWHVKEGYREETWKQRMAAHESIVSKAEEEAYRRRAADALAWAMPSLELKRINEEAGVEHATDTASNEGKVTEEKEQEEKDEQDRPSRT